MLFILTGTNKLQHHMFTRKNTCPHFSNFQIGNWKRGWFQVTLLNSETSAKQF